MTILREAEYEALKRIQLSGDVIDLGGERGAEYHKLIRGSFTISTANLDAKDADIICDLELPLPLPTESRDGILLINVLEHIYDYRQLLTESCRVLRPDGRIVVIVPFLFPVHPSPGDFHRFTATTLQRELSASGFVDISIETLGSGVFAACFVMIDRLMPKPIRLLGSAVFAPLAHTADMAFSWLALRTGKKYSPADYALGYCLTARKPG